MAIVSPCGWECADSSVNGVATSSSGLQAILDYLHREFGRAVIGVHNRTFGIWFDLIECMVQRDLSWPTTDVRVGYEVGDFARAVL